MDREKRLGWANLIVGIIFIIASITAFKNPEDNIKAIVLILAITAISKGNNRISVKDYDNYRNTRYSSWDIINI